MIKKTLFLFVLLISYISCAIGAEVIPEQDIVKINGIKIYKSEAEKFLEDIEDYEKPSVSYCNDNVNIIVDNSAFMRVVEKLYSLCEEELRKNDKCKESSRELGPRIFLRVKLDNNGEKIISELVVIR